MTDLRMQGLVGIVDPEIPGNVLKPRSDGRMPVEIEGAEVTLDVDVVALGPLQIAGFSDVIAEVTLDRALKTDSSATTQPVSMASLPLPSGASTAAAQATQIAAEEAIAADTDTLVSGQTLSNFYLDAIVDALAAPLAVTQSGVWSVSLSGTAAVTQSGAWSVAVSNFPATQPVSIAAPVAVTGPLTDTQLRAVPVPVSGSFFQGTQPISAVSLPLPASAATDARQDTGNTSLASIKTNTDKIPALGQGLMVASTPVVIASNQSAIPASQSGLWSVSVSGNVAVTGTFWQVTQPISVEALPLPAGAATSALQSSVQGTIEPDTAPASMSVIGAVYSARAPAPVDGDALALRTDSSGALLIATAPSQPSALDLAMLAEAQALRMMLALASPGFQVMPDGPSFWSQQG